MSDNRHLSPYSMGEKFARLLWAVLQATIFRYSFHTWNNWRIFLLNLFGASIDSTCVIRRTVYIECPWNLTMGRNSCLGDRVIAYCLGKLTLGERVTVSQYAHLCAGSHDYTKKDLPLTRESITIDNDAWIAADAFVGPNILIGEGAILGARAVTMKSLDAWTIYAGNPAKPVKSREMPS